MLPNLKKEMEYKTVCSNHRVLTTRASAVGASFPSYHKTKEFINFLSPSSSEKATLTALIDHDNKLQERSQVAVQFLDERLNEDTCIPPGRPNCLQHPTRKGYDFVCRNFRPLPIFPPTCNKLFQPLAFNTKSHLQRWLKKRRTKY